MCYTENSDSVQVSVISGRDQILVLGARFKGDFSAAARKLKFSPPILLNLPLHILFLNLFYWN